MNNVLNDFPDDFMEVFVKHDAELMTANKAQLKQGKKPDNSRIKPTYTVAYEALKKKEGSISAPYPDLYRTGGFYKSLFIVQTNVAGEVYVGSDYVVDGFPLGQSLLAKYGEDVLGFPKATLNKVSKKALKDYKTVLENGLKKL